MGEVFNLRQARKRADKVRSERSAAANRAVFGETKAERRKREVEADQAQRILDGARRVESPAQSRNDEAPK